MKAMGSVWWEIVFFFVYFTKNCLNLFCLLSHDISKRGELGNTVVVTNEGDGKCVVGEGRGVGGSIAVVGLMERK